MPSVHAARPSAGSLDRLRRVPLRMQYNADVQQPLHASTLTAHRRRHEVAADVHQPGRASRGLLAVSSPRWAQRRRRPRG
jgi:hypothetical protein